MNFGRTLHRNRWQEVISIISDNNIRPPSGQHVLLSAYGVSGCPRMLWEGKNRNAKPGFKNSQ